MDYCVVYDEAQEVETYDRVLWVIVKHNGYTYDLGGADTYWIDPDSNTFGVLYDNDQPPKSWQWAENGSVSISMDIPDTAKVFRGTYIPDDEWGRVRYAN